MIVNDDIETLLLGSGKKSSDIAWQEDYDEKQSRKERLRDSQQELTSTFLSVYEDGMQPSHSDGLHMHNILDRGSLCWRKMVLLHCYEQNPVYHGYLNNERFWAGNQFHDRMQIIIPQGLRARGLQVYSIEQPHLEDYWNIISRPDLIGDFEWPDGVFPTIYEFKGFNTTEWGNEVYKQKLPLKAIRQNVMYQYITGIHDRGLVIVGNKNDNRLWCFPVPYDFSLIEEYIPIFDRVKRFTDIHLADPHKLPKADGVNKRLPECTSPDAKTPKNCGACVACFSTPEERIALRRREAW